MFDQKNKKVPCVGISIGIERIFALLELKLLASNKKPRTTETDVFVASAQKNLVGERLKLCKQLWDADIRTEQSYKASPKLLTQLQYCELMGIPLAIVIGDGEIQNNVVKIRNVAARTEREVPRASMIEEIRSELSKLTTAK
jgi:histidyl-tRNA synthetase